MTDKPRLTCGVLLLGLLSASVAQAQPVEPPPVAPARPAPGAPSPLPAGNPPGAAGSAEVTTVSQGEAPGASAPVAKTEEAELEARFRALLGRPGGLTAEQVAERAVRSSWAVKSKAQEIEIAQANVTKAVSAYLPEVNLTASYTRYSSVSPGSLSGGGGSLVGVPAGNELIIPPGTPLIRIPGFSFPVILNQYWLQAGVVVPVSDYVLRAGKGVAAAKHNSDAARLNERASRLAAAADARIAYYDWVRVRMAQVVSEQTVDQSKEHLKTTQLTFENGRASRADVLRAEAQLSNATLLYSQAMHQANLAESRLRTMMHDDGEAPLAIGEEVLNSAVQVHPLYTFSSLYQEAAQKRLEVKALGESAAGLREAGNALKADQYPRVSVFGNAYYANPNTRIVPQREQFDATWDAGIRLTWTPTKIPGSRADARSYESQALQREADLGVFKDALRTEVMQAFQGLLEAEQDVGTAKQGLASAEEGYRVRKQMYQYGRATTVDLTDAETDLLRARLAMVNASIGLLTAQVRLEHSTGRDVK